MAEKRLLVVDDDRNHAEAMQMALERDGYLVEIADHYQAAMDRLMIREFDVVLTDLMLGDGNGLDLLRNIRERRPDMSVFLITGYGSVETAVQAMQEGAADYLTKPVNLAELRTRVERELEHQSLAEDNRELRKALNRRFGLEGMVGNAPPMERVFDLVRQAGPTDATVLVLGESGTGKELIARALHRLSQRSKRRFVAVNCAALTESLIESELFGHVKGAFTGADANKEGKFAFADGGTLFLDEIGDMPLSTQAKLLRVLENREVVPVGANDARPIDVRIVAATNRDLQQRVAAGEFREDLFYRLAVVAVEMPLLRERLEDIPLLLDHFLHEFAERHQKQVQTVSEDVLRTFRAHPWPGNVRELRNAVETMVVLDADGVLGVDDLPIALRDLFAKIPAVEVAEPSEASETPAPTAEATPAAASPASSAVPAPEPGIPYPPVGKSLPEVEKDMILATLASLEGNRQKAAKQLGIGERTLYRKLKGYESEDSDS
ncbi:MAG: sigma-54-dependent transcriptional regulator [Planctomycetota bacterium]